MVTIILLLLAAAPKPGCDAASQGKFWPEAANHSGEEVRRLSQSGMLEMCSAGNGKYRWRPLSVHVSRIARKHRRAG